jgi:uncharacterized membrane protein
MSLATVRPDSWNFPLFLHVAGAMVLVGALVVVAWALVKAWRGDAAGFTRLAYRTLLYVAIPSFIVMRAGAQWIADKEGILDSKSDPSWIGIGFGTSDLGLVLLIAATITAGVAARRLAREPGTTSKNARAAAVLTIIPLVLYLVAIWAMTAKPA